MYQREEELFVFLEICKDSRELKKNRKSECRDIPKTQTKGNESY